MTDPFPQLEQLPLADRTPYTKNSRTHSAAQIAQIADSLREFAITGRWHFCEENDCYVVTEDGEVLRVCRRQRTKSGSIAEKYQTVPLQGSLDVYGYKVYRMMVDGEKKHVKGHRLVANAFLTKGALTEVNHMDGVKTNNSVANLEWCSSGENQKHAISTGLKNPYKLNVKNQKIPYWEWTTIYAMAMHGGIKREAIARANGVCRQTIDNIINKVNAIMPGHHATA